MELRGNPHLRRSTARNLLQSVAISSGSGKTNLMIRTWSAGTPPPATPPSKERRGSCHAMKAAMSVRVEFPAHQVRLGQTDTQERRPPLAPGRNLGEHRCIRLDGLAWLRQPEVTLTPIYGQRAVIEVVHPVLFAAGGPELVACLAEQIKRKTAIPAGGEDIRPDRRQSGSSQRRARPR